MAEPTEYSFDLREVTAALLERQGITAGKWALALEFSVSTGALGSSPQDAAPGAMLQVSRMQLVKAPDDAPGDRLTVDASLLHALGGIGTLE